MDGGEGGGAGCCSPVFLMKLKKHFRSPSPVQEPVGVPVAKMFNARTIHN